MMNQILNQVRLQAEQSQASIAKTRLGLVDSYDPSTYSCKVKLQPDNTLTGWLPILSPWVGNGWGLFAPPAIGDLVEVQFVEGDINSGMVCLRFYNDSDRPLPAPSGAFWLVHASGSSLKFNNDGTVNLVSSSTLTSSAPQWNHTGNMTVTGNVIASGDISDRTNKSMAAMRAAYNSHSHTDPQGGVTGTPSVVM